MLDLTHCTEPQKTVIPLKRRKKLCILVWTENWKQSELLSLAGNEKIAEILIKHGVDMDHKDTYGCTPLHRAAEHG